MVSALIGPSKVHAICSRMLINIISYFHPICSSKHSPHLSGILLFNPNRFSRILSSSPATVGNAYQRVNFGNTVMTVKDDTLDLPKFSLRQGIL